MRATSDGQHVDFEVHVLMYIIDGVEDHQTAVAVYPNPTNGMVTIAIEGNSGYTYQVFDFTGKAVLDGKGQGQEMTLDLGGLGKGVYFISVMTENIRLTQKVIVQ